MIDKKLIKRNFSDNAKYYDKYSSIQNLCARKLIEKIDKKDINAILDIGCGTGNYTGLLREKFPEAKIKALDISKNMLESAKSKIKDIEFIEADAEEFETAEKFDLITSNATFQWFDRLERTLSKYKKLLNEDGCLIFSTFGHKTFYELNCSLKDLYDDNIHITSANFIDRQVLCRICSNLFDKYEITEETVIEDSGNLTELLQKIKYTGTRGNGIGSRTIWTKGRIAKLDKIYREKFGNIAVTYQVFFFKGYQYS